MIRGREARVPEDTHGTLQQANQRKVTVQGLCVGMARLVTSKETPHIANVYLLEVVTFMATFETYNVGFS